MIVLIKGNDFCSFGELRAHAWQCEWAAFSPFATNKITIAYCEFRALKVQFESLGKIQRWLTRIVTFVLFARSLFGLLLSSSITMILSNLCTLLVHQCAAKATVEDKSNFLQERHEVIASDHGLNEEVRVYGNPTSTRSVTSGDVTSISCAI